MSSKVTPTMRDKAAQILGDVLEVWNRIAEVVRCAKQPPN